MADTTLQQQLVTIIRQVRQAERDLQTSLSAETHDAQGALTAWSAKDVIGHIAATREEMAEALLAGREGRDATLYHDDFQGQNDRIFARFENTPWDDINAAADTSVETVIAELERLDDDQLRQTDSYPWLRQGSSMLTEVLGSMTHAYTHLAEVYVRDGNADAALALHETILPIYQTLSPTPRMLGMARYNLACTYALLGRGDLALPLLPEAFTLRPDLLDWAKTDTDLDSIRDSAEFQAFYA